MLASRDLTDGVLPYLDQKKRAATADIEECARLGDSHMERVARMWSEVYKGVYDDFTIKYGKNLIGAFRSLQDSGCIEIATCGATHGYFPLLSLDTSMQAQVKQAVSSYKRHFGRAPRGIWLPECAYRPSYKWSRPDGVGEAYPRKGVEEFLSENKIEYFFIDAHLLKGGKAIGVYLDRFEALQNLWARFAEQYKPLPESTEKTPYKAYWVGIAEGKMPVAVFTRDPKTGLQVWSGEWGYPGDGSYLDFHKKRFPGGMKYWKVTSAKADLADKKEYNPEDANSRISEHAGHFKELIKANLSAYLKTAKEPGIVVSPYDAELFGHWWFEGPEWLYNVIKNVHLDGSIDLVTAGEYLDKQRPTEVISF